MKLYNTLTKRLEEFKPINKDEVKIYTCGPTVYDFPHVGNYTSYIYWDLLIRTLKLNGYKVKRVLNLTDVGHLTSDADDGDDKLEKGAKR
jgi:cysteinyl-tRNA synthetase